AAGRGPGTRGTRRCSRLGVLAVDVECGDHGTGASAVHVCLFGGEVGDWRHGRGVVGAGQLLGTAALAGEGVVLVAGFGAAPVGGARDGTGRRRRHGRVDPVVAGQWDDRGGAVRRCRGGSDGGDAHDVGGATVAGLADVGEDATGVPLGA